MRLTVTMTRIFKRMNPFRIQQTVGLSNHCWPSAALPRQTEAFGTRLVGYQAPPGLIVTLGVAAKAFEGDKSAGQPH